MQSGPVILGHMGHSILLCRTAEDEIFAIGSRCTRQASPLEGGRVRGASIMFLLQALGFDLRTGRPSGGLKTIPLHSISVSIDDDKNQIGDELLP